MKAQDVIDELAKYENPSDAEFLQRFFKTGRGQYGEGDVFIGLRVPRSRKVARQFIDLSLYETEQLLESPIHEHRLVALIILTMQIKKADANKAKDIYDLYLRRTDRVNNWDLVDVSCRDIVGRYLFDKSRKPLYVLANSTSLWVRRIAIVSTWWFIREYQLNDTFGISKILLYDDEDLIQKAVGWMLREAGKRNEEALIEFLESYASSMPRTMLRYSIERLSVSDKSRFMLAKKRI